MVEPREPRLPERLAEQDEAEWERFRVSLEYATGFWLAFVFSPSSLDAAVIRHRVAGMLEAEGAGRMDVCMPQSPDELRQALPWMLSPERAGAGCVWVQSLQVDGAGRDEQPWADAWGHVFLRTNERREVLRRQLTGGLVIVAPLDMKVLVREAAPDLWSIRSIVLELSGTTAVRREQASVVVEEKRPLEEHRTTTTAPDPVFWIVEANRRKPGSEGRAIALDQATLGWVNEGRFAEAMATAAEAVDICRKLAEERPETSLPLLAASLNNLGNVQGELGQHEAALASMQEVVNIRRKLLEEHPETFLPNLAASLHNLGIWQSSLDSHEAALASTQEAVDIRRKLAEQRPDAFLPDLAGSLANLGIQQSALGQREAALSSAQEAVGIRRKLAEQRPETFLPGLARSLHNLGVTQSILGQHEAALASVQEAFDIYWDLYQQSPQASANDVRKTIALLRDLHAAVGTPIDPATQQRIEQLEAD